MREIRRYDINVDDVIFRWDALFGKGPVMSLGFSNAANLIQITYSKGGIGNGEGHLGTPSDSLVAARVEAAESIKSFAIASGFNINDSKSLYVPFPTTDSYMIEVEIPDNVE